MFLCLVQKNEIDQNSVPPNILQINTFRPNQNNLIQQEWNKDDLYHGMEFREIIKERIVHSTQFL